VTIHSTLKAAGITEMTYRALVRNVSFMHPRRKGQEEFSQAELLALKAFALLRAHGLRSSIAGAALELAYPEITRFTTNGKLRSRSAYKIGVRLMSVRGRLVATPINEAGHPGAEVGRVELDLRGVAELLPGVRRTNEKSHPLFNATADGGL
jgi:hypothetical protein